MQQMNQEEMKESQRTYGGYEGPMHYQERQESASGQKLNLDDDEHFAEILARKIKQELKDEVEQERSAIIKYRLALAIVSICALVPLFVALVVALALGLGNGGTGAALGWGFVAVCIVIISVNGYFHSAKNK